MALQHFQCACVRARSESKQSVPMTLEGFDQLSRQPRRRVLSDPYEQLATYSHWSHIRVVIRSSTNPWRFREIFMVLIVDSN